MDSALDKQMVRTTKFPSMEGYARMTHMVKCVIGRKLCHDNANVWDFIKTLRDTAVSVSLSAVRYTSIMHTVLLHLVSTRGNDAVEYVEHLLNQNTAAALDCVIRKAVEETVLQNNPKDDATLTELKQLVFQAAREWRGFRPGHYLQNPMILRMKQLQANAIVSYSEHGKFFNKKVLRWLKKHDKIGAVTDEELLPESPDVESAMDIKRQYTAQAIVKAIQLMRRLQDIADENKIEDKPPVRSIFPEAKHKTGFVFIDASTFLKLIGRSALYEEAVQEASKITRIQYAKKMAFYASANHTKESLAAVFGTVFKNSRLQRLKASAEFGFGFSTDGVNISLLFYRYMQKKGQ